MDCYLLGQRPGLESMLTFHALARLGREALVIVSPASPMISLGFFEDAAAVLDLKNIEAAGWPIFRREVGGGTTYLDRNQIFYQLVIGSDHPLARRPVMDLYRLMADPARRAYQTVGIVTEFKPVNDVVTDKGLKISGQGGGDIGECLVLVGGLLLDFDAAAFCRMVNVPDEKFRDKLFTTVEQNVTSIRKELGFIPQRSVLEAALREGFEQLLGPLTIKTDLEGPVKAEMARLEEKFSSTEWIRRGRKKGHKAGIKVASGVYLRSRTHKAEGGLIRAEVSQRDGKLEKVELSGDLTVLPRRRLAELEEALIGVEADQESVLRAVRSFLSGHEAQMPGVTPLDLARTIAAD